MADKGAAAKGRNTRTELIRAAATEFNRAGFQGTNTNKIARAAGFAPATFYRYFEDKSAIMVAAFEWILDEQRAAVLNTMGGSFAPEDLPRVALSVVRVLVAFQHEWQSLIASGLVVAASDPQLSEVIHSKRTADLAAMQLICAQLGSEPSTREDDLLLLLTVEGLCMLLATSDIHALGLDAAQLEQEMANRLVAHILGDKRSSGAASGLVT